ncbi:hypothetical protein B7492_32835 (plasmid) [Bacillus mycoides]|uniref:Uncharacterized protein n=1 Tax=Bacillus mycoides TaxID=1405 RepID=A0A1W6AJ13_BACMY|nr:hypothetical protein B7492_32835 [Bacillus mycoides]
MYLLASMGKKPLLGRFLPIDAKKEGKTKNINEILNRELYAFNYSSLKEIVENKSEYALDLFYFF